jgi:transposase, IS5 family
MRLARELHNPLFRQYSEHSFSEKLSQVASKLDAHPEIADWVLEDLTKGKDPRGAKGMTAEEVIRAAILMQIQNLTYAELEYQIADSQSARAFIRVPDGITYSDSALQTNIKGISVNTWQKVQRLTVLAAKESALENGRTVRMDATVVETNIAHPMDSNLLVDCLRVISRCVHWMQEKGLKSAMKYSHKKGKKEQLAILNAKDEEERRVHYVQLIIGAGDVWKQLSDLVGKCEQLPAETKGRQKHIEQLRHVECHLEAILAQTIARVIDGRSVHSSEKIVSIFEEHSDVIVKGRRDTEFGHKVFFTTGKSNLVIDCEIAEGNPADSEKFMDLLEQVSKLYGRYPRQTTCDGGFASKENVIEAKKRGIKDVCFTKRCAMDPEEMCKSRSVFKKLARLRAGIESNISALKRGYGLGRAAWKGLEGFKAYVWSAVVAYNFMLLAS